MKKASVIILACSLILTLGACNLGEIKEEGRH